MSSFTVQALEEKLSRLSASQDSIETLSLWIIHHKAHATLSVTVWLDKLENGEENVGLPTRLEASLITLSRILQVSDPCAEYAYIRHSPWC